jgi:hypothetical protein
VHIKPQSRCSWMGHNTLATRPVTITGRCSSRRDQPGWTPPGSGQAPVSSVETRCAISSVEPSAGLKTTYFGNRPDINQLTPWPTNNHSTTSNINPATTSPDLILATASLPRPMPVTNHAECSSFSGSFRFWSAKRSCSQSITSPNR